MSEMVSGFEAETCVCSGDDDGLTWNSNEGKRKRSCGSF